MGELLLLLLPPSFAARLLLQDRQLRQGVGGSGVSSLYSEEEASALQPAPPPSFLTPSPQSPSSKDDTTAEESSTLRTPVHDDQENIPPPLLKRPRPQQPSRYDVAGVGNALGMPLLSSFSMYGGGSSGGASNLSFRGDEAASPPRSSPFHPYPTAAAVAAAYSFNASRGATTSLYHDPWAPEAYSTPLQLTSPHDRTLAQMLDAVSLFSRSGKERSGKTPRSLLPSLLSHARQQPGPPNVCYVEGVHTKEQVVEFYRVLEELARKVKSRALPRIKAGFDSRPDKNAVRARLRCFFHCGDLRLVTAALDDIEPRLVASGFDAAKVYVDGKTMEWMTVVARDEGLFKKLTVAFARQRGPPYSPVALNDFIAFDQ